MKKNSMNPNVDKILEETLKNLIPEEQQKFREKVEKNSAIIKVNEELKERDFPAWVKARSRNGKQDISKL